MVRFGCVLFLRFSLLQLKFVTSLTEQPVWRPKTPETVDTSQISQRNTGILDFLRDPTRGLQITPFWR